MNLSVLSFTLATGTLFGDTQAVLLAEDYIGAMGATVASTCLLPMVPRDLPPEQQDSLGTLLLEYKDIFALADDDNIGHMHLAEHIIHMQGPPCRVPY